MLQSKAYSQSHRIPNHDFLPQTVTAAVSVGQAVIEPRVSKNQVSCAASATTRTGIDPHPCGRDPPPLRVVERVKHAGAGEP
jgi:hypothetical protein